MMPDFLEKNMECKKKCKHVGNMCSGCKDEQYFDFDAQDDKEGVLCPSCEKPMVLNKQVQVGFGEDIDCSFYSCNDCEEYFDADAQE